MVYVPSGAKNLKFRTVLSILKGRFLFLYKCIKNVFLILISTNSILSYAYEKKYVIINPNKIDEK